MDRVFRHESCDKISNYFNEHVTHYEQYYLYYGLEDAYLSKRFRSVYSLVWNI